MHFCIKMHRENPKTVDQISDYPLESFLYLTSISIDVFVFQQKLV